MTLPAAGAATLDPATSAADVGSRFDTITASHEEGPGSGGTALLPLAGVTVFLMLTAAATARRELPGFAGGGRSASLDVTERRRYEERLRDLTRQLVTAQERERRRIARELHDDVSQRLALLAIAIDQIHSASADQGIRDRMRDLSAHVTAIAKSVHGLAHGLHPSELDALGLVHALRTLGRELSAAGLRVALIAEGDCRDLSPVAALGLFRVIQEALSNVLKHSGATEAIVTLRQSPDALKLRVEDHGRGFNPAIGADGLGLHSMRERLTLMGGVVQIRSRPGEGTIVEARLPRAQISAAAPTQAA